IRFNRRFAGTPTEYFQFPNEAKMARMERLFNQFLITETLPVINWQISGDTASFGGLLCQKATSHFMGRDYIAWFCPDLPQHVGPWKLNGLPGVILDVHDVSGDVRFTFDGIEKAVVSTTRETAPPSQSIGNPGGMTVMFGMEDLNNDPNIIKLPENAIKTTDKEFAQLQETARKDPEAFARSITKSQGMTTDNGAPTLKFNFRAGEQPVINNPIELPEKK
ncbi:MAG TPA: GLPGLI family protein, partial [Puia sp.]|nr:GLPGLI family protein [Puia sp.]